MNPHLYILTGSSRGMGLAMARQLAVSGNTLVCIARHPDASLPVLAASAGATLISWTLDLADGAAAAGQLGDWLAAQPSQAFSTAALINNAGVIPQIRPLAETEASDLTNALRVGLEAPMLLTSAFLRATAHWPGNRKVLNVSSGLGRRAMASQTVYCAAKAGLDHFTRCLALEEALKPHGARVCSLAPGVIDTDMQAHLRSADASAFPDQANFLHLKTQGLLASPDDAATRVLNWLRRDDFGAQPVADVRDA